MNWIQQLDKNGFNFLIDELVWHLEQERFPLTIRKINSNIRTGFEFVFKDGETHFLNVKKDALEQNWSEAIAISKEYPELKGVIYENS